MSEELNNINNTNIDSTSGNAESKKTDGDNSVGITADYNAALYGTKEDGNIDKSSDNDNNSVINDTIKEEADIPLVSYIAEAPKTSTVFAELESENEDEAELDLRFNTEYGRYMNQIIPERKPDIYRWSASEENKTQIDILELIADKDEKKNKKNKREKKKVNSLGLKIFAAAMSVMFLFTSSSTAFYMLSERNSAKIESALSETPIISNSKAVEEERNSILENTGITIGENNPLSKVLGTQEIIAKVKPSVVCIEVTTEIVSNFSSFFGRNGGSPQTYTQESIGTGFILTEDGYIVTNYHVVESASTVKVTLSSGESYTAEVIGGDEAADIAVIKINAKNLPVAELGDSDGLVQGDDVVAIGTPAGIEFAGTATKGIVSAINRDVDVPVSSGLSVSSKIMTVIQTDASINPGNSGGPLANDKGQVIGITTMKLASDQFEGMGFAIPINIAIPVINDIIENPGIREDTSTNTSVEDTSTVSLGIEGNTVTEEISQLYGIPQGFKIAKITENGACDGSGIQVSDIIVGFNGTNVTSYEELIEMKKTCKPGDKATITVYRNGDTYDFDIVLAAR